MLNAGDAGSGGWWGEAVACCGVRDRGGKMKRREA